MAKVERKVVKPKFEPVTITLESQVEVDAMYSLLGANYKGLSGADFYDTYIELGELGATLTPLKIKKEI